MVALVERGVRRTARPDVFLSHSRKDTQSATKLAIDLNFCAVDVWLDDWELQIGQSLNDSIGKAMGDARYIAILITENYNTTIWTKKEYKKALSRQESEERVVMLPLIIGEAVIPDFLEDKIYVDLRREYYSGLTRIAGMIHELSEFRVKRAIDEYPPKRVSDIWRLLESIGFNPYIVLGQDDFEEVLKHGGHRIREDYGTFSPELILSSSAVSNHVKVLLREVI